MIRMIDKHTIMEIWKEETDLLGMKYLRIPIIVNDTEDNFGVTTDPNGHIKINTAYFDEFSDNDAITVLRYLIRHEIGHYRICPYDDLTLAYMTGMIRSKYGVDNEMALYIFNFFSDILVNYHNHIMFGKTYLDGIKQFLDFIRNKIDGTSKTFVLYEALNTWFDGDMNINDIDVFDDDTKKRIKRIITYIVKGKSWKLLLRNFLNYFESIFDDSVSDYDPITTSETSGEGLTNPNTDSVKLDEYESIPKDIAAVLGNPSDVKSKSKAEGSEKSNNDIEKFLDKLDDMNGKEASYSIDQYRNLVRNDFSEMDLIKRWFAKKSHDLVKYNVMDRHKMERERDGYGVWYWHDPVSHLNFPKSIMSNPALLFPPYTRKTKYTMVDRGIDYEGYNDLLIVIDTSASMGKLSSFKLESRIDYTILYAYALIQWAIKYKIKYNLINFSNKAITTGWCNPIDSTLEKTENILFKQIGYGTYFPIELIKKSLLGHEKCTIVIISDMEIYNIEKLINLFNDPIIYKNNPVYIIHITESFKESVRDKFAYISKNIRYYHFSNLEKAKKIVLDIMN